MAEQNVVNNATKLLPCDWTWETWTKTAGYVQAIVGVLNVVAIPVFLIQLMGMKNDLIMKGDSANAKFNNENSSYFFIYMAGTMGITTSKISESQYSYIVGYHVTLWLLQMAFTVLAVYLLIGVHKKDLKHITQGIALKMCLFLLFLILFFSQLIVTACGFKSDIWGRFFMIVGDGLYIKVLNYYLQSLRDELAAAELTGRLPKLVFTLLNFVSPIKIPTFKLPFLTSKK